MAQRSAAVYARALSPNQCLSLAGCSNTSTTIEAGTLGRTRQVGLSWLHTWCCDACRF